MGSRLVHADLGPGAVLLMALVGEPLRRVPLSTPVLKQDEKNDK